MNEAIVERWNSVVQPDDIVYHLGDVMLGNNDEAIKYLKALKGHIYLALGNHDSDVREEMYLGCWNVVDVQMAYRIKAAKKTIILNHYPTIVSNYDDKNFIRTMCLCGHTHTKDKFKDFQYGCYHVELDAHDCYPVNLDTIIEDMKRKKEEIC